MADDLIIRAAFTDADTRLAPPGRDIFPSLRSSHAVLNPGVSGRAFAPNDIAQILGDPRPSQNPPHGAPGHVNRPGRAITKLVDWFKGFVLS